MPIRLAITLLLIYAANICTAQASSAASDRDSAHDQRLEAVLAANVKTEWDAFKNKDKKAYSDLLADDFVAVEEDGDGTRNRYKAVSEIDNSNISNYDQRFFKVFPLSSNVALVTYELTFIFPPRSAVRFKRVFISEIWIRKDAQWKLRHYQETSVK
ncbi:MAG: nuclear transport factor 2 family protein [Acidobacteriaceae bacterium]|nr:nuclear transport factor 2 family protein [Acidobacteriaceae bacterium]